MYCVNERFQMIRINVRRNAMAEVKDMTGSVSVACQHIGNALFDHFW